VATTGPPRSNVPDQTLGNWRWVLIVCGIAIATGGFLLWVFPVDHTKPAPAGTTCATPQDCFVKVDDAPELLLSTLVVLGVLVTLIGFNNRRITKFAGPGGISFETEQAVVDMAAAKAEQKAEEAGVSPAEKASAKLVAGERARAMLAQHVAAAQPASTVALEQIAEAASDASVQLVRRDPDIA